MKIGEVTPPKRPQFRGGGVARGRRFRVLATLIEGANYQPLFHGQQGTRASAGHKRKSLVKIGGEVTPPKRPSILGPLELEEPIDHSGTPLPPGHLWGDFRSPPSNSDPPSYPPLGLATGIR